MRKKLLQEWRKNEKFNLILGENKISQKEKQTPLREKITIK